MVCVQNYSNKAGIDLWALGDDIRGIKPDDIMIYVFGLMFFAYLSEKLQKFVYGEFQTNEEKFAELNDHFLNQKIEAQTIQELGYSINPEYYFIEIVNKANNGGYIIDDLKKAFNDIETSSKSQKSEHSFKNIFEDIDLYSTKLGKNDIDRNFIVSRILINLSKINFNVENDEKGIYGDIFEYLISKYSSNVGKRGPSFYTPQQVSELLSRIVTIGKNKVNSVYDPACGSASLILNISKKCRVNKFYGQEIDRTTFNLARMNMIIHNVSYEDFNIALGDTLTDPQHSDQKFEVILSKPPFAVKWSASDDYLEDERFKDFGRLAPSSKADYAFIQHMIYHLNDDGVMAVVMPHGILFRGGTEGAIRKHIIGEKNYIDAVIGLPTNIFYETAIQSVVMILKKSRRPGDDILFVDASKGFERARPYNILKERDIQRIVEVYANRETIDKFSYVASLSEIEKNNYNLNIPRYVDTFEEEEFDRAELIKELKIIQDEINETDKKIVECCKKLGTKVPVFVRC